MSLPTYTSEHTCPKCGATEGFYEDWKEFHKWRPKERGPEEEHISVHCGRWHYAWYMAPLDAAAMAREGAQ